VDGQAGNQQGRLRQHVNLLLILEDDKNDVLAFGRMFATDAKLTALFQDGVYACSFEQARSCIANQLPDCCLMDYNLPEGKATDLIKSLKQQGLRFPIVISTGAGSERLVVELMQLGVQDYLTKDDLSPAVLLRTLRNAMTTFQLESEIYYRAHFDGLTSLANRVTFMVRLREAVEQAERYQRRICCSMLMWITLNKSTMPMVMNGVTTYSRRWLNDCVHALDKRTSLRVSEVMSLCFCFTRLMCAKAF